MIENIICSFCICWAFALQNNGNCHKCDSGSRQDAIAVMWKLNSPHEFMSIACFKKGQKHDIDFGSKQGSIMPKTK